MRMPPPESPEGRRHHRRAFGPNVRARVMGRCLIRRWGHAVAVAVAIPTWSSVFRPTPWSSDALVGRRENSDRGVRAPAPPLASTASVRARQRQRVREDDVAPLAELLVDFQVI